MGTIVGEPCNTITWCNQAYRWNLDRVVDPNGNITQIAYTRETNDYQRASSNGFTGTRTTYVRGAVPQRIEYGINATGGSGVKFPARVFFDATERCIEQVGFGPSATCGSTPNTNSWPDTPTDLDCSSGTCSEHSPSFYTKKRLWQIVAWSVENTTNGTWRAVDKVRLTHEFLASAGTGGKLYLREVRRTGNPTVPQSELPAGTGLTAGYTGANLTLPKIVLSYTEMASRADSVTFNMNRLTLVKDEMGMQTAVTYTILAPCPMGETDPNKIPNAGWDRNTYNCWPVWTSPDGLPAGWAIHHKYLVTQVEQNDVVSNSPTVTTAYTYFFTDLNPATDEEYLWHHDNDPLTPNTNQTYGDWRGYPLVITTNGTTKTETRYFRGMHGDANADNTTKTVVMKDSEGTTKTDHDWLNGQVRETRSLDVSDQRITGSLHSYSSIAQTASQTSPMYSPRIARYVREDSTFGRVESSTGTVNSRTDLTYDTTTGMVTQSWDQGNINTAADNRCTLTFYTSSSSLHIYVPSQSQLVSSTNTTNGCTTATTTRSWTLNYYDGAASNSATPTKGNLTKVERLAAGSTFISTQTGYDAYGRATSVTDGRGLVTSTAYTPTNNALTTSTTVTNPSPFLWTTVSALERLRMMPDTVTDPNGKVTDYSYDGLGRTTGVKTPVNSTYNMVTFGYTLDTMSGTTDTGSLQAPAKVRTSQLASTTGTYRDSFVYYDGFGRERESQGPAAPGATGRTVVASTYTNRGLLDTKSGAFNAAGAAGSGLVNDATPPQDHLYLSDETGRVVTDRARHASGATMVNDWTTTTSYDGLLTRVTSPEGRIADTIVDVFGQTTQQTQRLVNATAYATTTNTFGFLGELLTSSDADANLRSYSYDMVGRMLTSADPDQGLTTLTYDANNNVITSTDAPGNVVWMKYDNLNRPTERRQTNSTGAFLARLIYWTGTDTPATYKGQLKEERGYWFDDPNTTSLPYNIKYDSFDNGYRLTQKTFDFPNAPLGARGPFTYSYTHNVDGTPNTMSYPAVGGLAAETVTNEYHAGTGRPTRLQSSYNGGAATYLVYDTTFTSDGLLSTRTLGRSADYQAIRTYAYDTNTRRLVTIQAETETATSNQIFQQDTYGYSDYQNVATIKDAVANQRQCFRYDDLNRLDRAWTQTGTTACNTTTPAPDTTAPDPYNHSYGYDSAEGAKTGNISQYTSAPVGGSSTVYNLVYPAPGAARPHSVTGLNNDTYSYLTNGNLTTRTVAGISQGFYYYTNGKLRRVNDTTGANSGRNIRMTYDPNGQRIQRTTDNPGTSNDETTIYLDNQELKVTNTSTGTQVGAGLATRYYTHGGATIGLRANTTTLHWLLGNHQGSASHTIQNNQYTTIKTQRYEPFGKPRGATNQLPTDRDFLGQTQDDTTNLNYLNNRYYDPNTLHFTTVDPLVSETLEPYGYAGNNPATYSDPTGLDWCCNPIRHIKNAGKKALEKAGDGVHALKEAGGDAVDAVSKAGRAVKTVASASWDRGSTFATYEFQALRRQATNPIQSTWDFFTFSTLAEQNSAMEAILIEDGELYSGGSDNFCGREAECITGVFVGSFGAQTTGHTIRFAKDGTPSDSLIAHEMQHVYDTEQLGGLGMLLGYSAASLLCLCYENNYFEQRAFGLDGARPRGILSQFASYVWKHFERLLDEAQPILADSPKAGPGIRGGRRK